MSKRFKVNTDNTFRNEIRFLESFVPSALYGIQEIRDSFDENYFQFLTTIIQQLNESQNFVDHSYEQPTIRPFDITDFLDQIKDKESLEFNIMAHLGVDFNIDTRHESSDGLANLVAEFGRDAFGCYLPMHAFFNSPKTPWGIYLFPELIAERAKFLFIKKPSNLTLAQHYILYFYAVYRHELFHYQTERFATKLEIGFKQPFYKPYKENVYRKLQYTEHWLEEALAEGAVLDSILVSNRTKISKEDINIVYEYDLQFMPPGYKDYKCKFYGDRANAHLVFASQIINASINRQERTTKLLQVKGEFGADDREVPVYIVTGLASYIEQIRIDDYITID